MSLRIQSGRFRGTNLKAPDGNSTRPTAARTREAIWSMLRPYLSDQSVFIDLFSGSGIMGLEAASNGASEIEFIENNKKALRTLDANIELVNRQIDRGQAQQRPVFNVCPIDVFKYKIRGKKADITWADPPLLLSSTAG